MQPGSEEAAGFREEAVDACEQPIDVEAREGGELLRLALAVRKHVEVCEQRLGHVGLRVRVRVSGEGEGRVRVRVRVRARVRCEQHLGHVGDALGKEATLGVDVHGLAPCPSQGSRV